MVIVPKKYIIFCDTIERDSERIFFIESSNSSAPIPEEFMLFLRKILLDLKVVNNLMDVYQYEALQDSG